MQREVGLWLWHLMTGSWTDGGISPTGSHYLLAAPSQTHLGHLTCRTVEGSKLLSVNYFAFRWQFGENVIENCVPQRYNDVNPSLYGKLSADYKHYFNLFDKWQHNFKYWNIVTSSNIAKKFMDHLNISCKCVTHIWYPACTALHSTCLIEQTVRKLAVYPFCLNAWLKPNMHYLPWRWQQALFYYLGDKLASNKTVWLTDLAR